MKKQNYQKPSGEMVENYFTPELEMFLKEKDVYPEAVDYVNQGLVELDISLDDVDFESKPLKYLSHSFVFMHTPEGFDFWYKLHIEFQNRKLK